MWKCVVLRHELLISDSDGDFERTVGLRRAEIVRIEYPG